MLLSARCTLAFGRNSFLETAEVAVDDITVSFLYVKETTTAGICIQPETDRKVVELDSDEPSEKTTACT